MTITVESGPSQKLAASAVYKNRKARTDYGWYRQQVTRRRLQVLAACMAGESRQMT